MRPMILKQPTPCCGSPTLIWMPEHGRYHCPCGKFRATQDGLHIKDRHNRPRSLQFGKPSPAFKPKVDLSKAPKQLVRRYAKTKVNPNFYGSHRTTNERQNK